MATYKEAGVDVNAGTEAIVRIKKHVRETFNANVLTDLGGFGGCFQFPKDKYDDPVLISSADGVGTKLKLAFLTNRHDTIGQCLVNHCVDDILAVGARPLFFLDYFAAGKLNIDVFEEVVSGLSKACKENECVLIGGETAEMPDFYSPGDYDISGTIIRMFPRAFTKVKNNRTINLTVAGHQEDVITPDFSNLRSPSTLTCSISIVITSRSLPN